MQWGEFKVTEKYFTMDQVVRAVNEGRVYEMFGSGTAATVSPVGQIKYQGCDVNIPLALGECGKLTKRCWDTIYDIQVRKWRYPAILCVRVDCQAPAS